MPKKCAAPGCRLSAPKIASVLLYLLPACLPAGTLTVPASANIFGGGHLAVPAGPYGAGILPSEFDFTPGSGLVLSFSSVTGIVNCTGYPDDVSGPDGYPDLYTSWGGTNIDSVGGIAGIQYTGQRMFMVGVFLDATEPVDPAPTRLVFSSANDTPEFSPGLRQVFFIGDGLMADGSTHQKFNVPSGASRLYLGFADGYYFTGTPGSYGDNSGTLTASFSIDGPTSVPEPGSAGLALVGLGLAAIGVRKRLIS